MAKPIRNVAGVALLTVAVVTVHPVLAQGNGNGRGNGNGGGGEDPPPEPPVIVFSNDGVVSLMDADGQAITPLIDTNNGQLRRPGGHGCTGSVPRENDGDIRIINADGRAIG